VVQAVRWLCGEKVDAELLRSGAESASAEALFDLSSRPELTSLLEELGIDPSEDGLLRIRRELHRGGRSRAFLDGRRTSAAHLSRVCEALLQLQSQHQQTQLLDARRHRKLLDACGVDASLRSRWRNAFGAWNDARRALSEWERRREEIRAQREILEYQRGELREAGLREGEMEDLLARVNLGVGGARILEAAAAARERLEDEDRGALRSLAEASARLGHFSSQLSELEEVEELLVQAQELAGEAARILERFGDAAEIDPARLEADQSRLARLEELCRKYRRTEAELVLHLTQLEAQLDAEEWGEEAPTRLTAPLEQSRLECERVGNELLRERRRQAKATARAANSLLSDLGMPEAELVFEVEPLRDAAGPMKIAGNKVLPTSAGPEGVRLLVRTNRGESLGPVERIASGGELSRIGLVLRTLAVEDRQPALLVLDEVDAGVGADLGPAIADRLIAMSARVQLLVVTHLPAIAARAGRHLLAEKGPSGDRTVSRILEVRGEERVEELTRMIGGAHRAARALATQLLQADRLEGAS
jgi:DNA repair protein RecN (Recombination protein N)